MRCFTRFAVAAVGALCLWFGVSASAAQPLPKPAKPTEAVELAGCVTAECHVAVKDFKFLHGPVNANTCDACHKLLDPKAHTYELVRQKAELCTFCHEFNTGAMPVVHQPVIEGQCLGCHNPHGGTAATMLREASVAQMCGRCHDNVAQDKRFVHKPVMNGECDSCHQPHAAKYPKLLDAVGSDLCLTCHTDFKSQMAKVKFTHKAMDEGCAKCHSAHGSNFPKNIAQSLPDLCLSCHESIKTTTQQAAYKHPAVVGDRACMSCHTAHGGDLARLMADLPVKVCMSCHDKPIKPEKGPTIPAMTGIADPKTFKHGPIRDGQCGGCHTTHGGDRPLLLRKTLTKSFYQRFSEENYELCFSCHDPQLAQQEQAAGMTHFRNGERNLHFVHVTKAERGRNCSVCHDTHASKFEQDIHDQVPFGKWQLPIAFTRSSTGGSCVTGCHATWAYDRDNPVALPSGAPEPPRTPRVVAADRSQPILAKWSGKSIRGQALSIPHPQRPSVLLFIRADQPQSQQALKMIEAALKDDNPAQVALILSGVYASEQAEALAQGDAVAWPIVADPAFALSKQLGIEVWPATLVIQADGVVAAHIGGAPLSLAADLQAYLDFAAGRIDRPMLNQRLASRSVVADGPKQKATWHLQMGGKLLSEGKPDQAATMFVDGLKLQPDLVPLRLGLIEALVHAKQTKPAVEALSKLPKNALPAWQQSLLRAKVLLLQRRTSEAKVLLEALVKEKPDTPDAHYLLGTIYEQEKDWENAAKAYRAAKGSR